MKKFTNFLKKTGKFIKKIGIEVLKIIVIIIEGISNPKRAGQPGSGGDRLPRNGEGEPREDVVDDGQKPDDEVIYPSSQEATADEQDNNDRLIEPEDEDLPEDSYLENNWLDDQYTTDPNYSPLGLEGVYDNQSESLNSRYSLGIDYSLNPQRNPSDPKNFNNNSPEKQQNTPSKTSIFEGENFKRQIALNSFAKSHQPSQITTKDTWELQKEIDAKISFVDSSERDGKKYVVVGYTDKNGDGYLYVSEVDSKGNVNAAQLDMNSKIADKNSNLFVKNSNISGEQVVEIAEQRSKDYGDRKVKYVMGGDASQGGTTSDCSHFVKDVLSSAGLKTPYTTTKAIEKSPYFYQIPPEQAQPGDIIVQSGHMGIYTGKFYTDKKYQGSPEAIQMGGKGARPAPWGPKGWFSKPEKEPRYYRPKG
jgi:cell wall-associated NlpC family hydrolase